MQILKFSIFLRPPAYFEMRPNTPGLPAGNADGGPVLPALKRKSCSEGGPATHPWRCPRALPFTTGRTVCHHLTCPSDLEPSQPPFPTPALVKQHRLPLGGTRAPTQLPHGECPRASHCSRPGNTQTKEWNSVSTPHGVGGHLLIPTSCEKTGPQVNYLRQSHKAQGRSGVQAGSLIQLPPVVTSKTISRFTAQKSE